MRSWFRSGIFRGIVLAILGVSLLPLILIGGVAMRSGSEAGAESIALSREALDAKSTEMLELRAVETANSIARFLQGCEADLRALALLPRTDAAYQAFLQAHKGDLWLVEDGKEIHQSALLYREAAYVDAGGQEVIKITSGQIDGDLRDVTNQANTLYHAETYFDDARLLPAGEIYVSHLIGPYVSQAEASAGEHYSGIFRFAMPVFDQDGRFDGVVTLALDARHVQEFTSHIVPTSERVVAAPDPKQGNYAYIIDDQSYTVAHPNMFYLRGIDPQGALLPYAARVEDLGKLPVRLDRIGFADANLASIPAKAATGNPGSIQYRWQGRDKFVAYAPIPYYGGAYDPPVGFGWVGVSADLNTFHAAATLVGEAIQERVQMLGIITLGALLVTALIVVVVAGVLAQRVASPIQRIIEAARRVEANDFNLSNLDPLLNRRSQDEIGRLAQVFKEMAGHVEKREQIRRLLDVVISIGVALPEEKNFNRLLETIVQQAMSLCNADAGTLYLRTPDDHLKFVILRNNTLNVALGGTTGMEIPYPPIPLFDSQGAPNHANIASYTMHSRELINVPDAYQDSRFDFSGTRTYDQQSGYSSRSFLSAPLKDSSNEIIGVLQLINARDPQTGAPIPFDAGMNRVIESLASLGTVALRAYVREAELREKIEELRIEIDEARKYEQVAEITESEYFHHLKERARELRSKPGQHDHEKP